MSHVFLFYLCSFFVIADMSLITIKITLHHTHPLFNSIHLTQPYSLYSLQINQVSHVMKIINSRSYNVPPIENPYVLVL